VKAQDGMFLGKSVTKNWRVKQAKKALPMKTGPVAKQATYPAPQRPIATADGVIDWVDEGRTD